MLQLGGKLFRLLRQVEALTDRYLSSESKQYIYEGQVQIVGCHRAGRRI